MVAAGIFILIFFSPVEAARSSGWQRVVNEDCSRLPTESALPRQDLALPCQELQLHRGDGPSGVVVIGGRIFMRVLGSPVRLCL